MTVTQDNRFVRFDSPLGKDKLMLRRCVCIEELGRPFRFDLDLYSTDASVDFAALLGQKISISLERWDEGEPRYMHGVVSRFVMTGRAGEYIEYHATVVPWLWLLTRTSDCRIFQQMTAPEIIKQVFQDRGFADFEDALTGQYPKREHSVQYRETDFNFVSRLMEAEGIYYYFKHTQKSHKLVLVDSPQTHQSYPNYEKLSYLPDSDSQVFTEHIREWSIEQQLQPTKYALNDFDFKAPTKKLAADHKIDREHTYADFEMFDHPGEYVESSDGKHYAKVRVEELQAQYEVGHGRTDARGLCTGYMFEMTDHGRQDQCRQYLVTSTTIHIEADEMTASSAIGTQAMYTCQFTAIDAKQPYRPPRLTSKPFVQGPQTAIVVGKSGEEIWTDKYGRIKVHFHWDRHDNSDENSSCWVRVSQSWAGARWGAIHIPRVGQEVIVEFLEGDPDRPIITGRVYNNDQMPPYDLPAKMTQSGLKSRSTKKGGADNFNEIRFEDAKGEEEVVIHAERDMCTTVEHDQTTSIKNNREQIVDGTHTETIKKDTKITISEGNFEIFVSQGTMARTVAKKVSDTYSDEHSELVTKMYQLQAQTVEITGVQEIKLGVGGNYVKIDMSGITIVGTLVKIN